MVSTCARSSLPRLPQQSLSPAQQRMSRVCAACDLLLLQYLLSGRDMLSLCIAHLMGMLINRFKGSFGIHVIRFEAGLVVFMLIHILLVSVSLRCFGILTLLHKPINDILRQLAVRPSIVGVPGSCGLHMPMAARMHHLMSVALCQSPLLTTSALLTYSSCCSSWKADRITGSLRLALPIEKLATVSLPALLQMPVWSKDLACL